MSEVNYAPQYGTPCLQITPEDAAHPESVVREARNEGAIFRNADGEHFVVEFDDPDRPGVKELYTERALRASLKTFAKKPT